MMKAVGEKQRQKVINNYTGDKDRIEMFSSGMEFLEKRQIL